ncbi:hypothetical protein SDC9_201635 [bioreactor metagenome]|uniref:Uncharacterized protein n=1 Tax=bioreactor metagenome TaxID=1076179 RepID=A0A645IS73_9ZZZZ
MPVAIKHIHHVVDKIGLTTVDQLEVGVFLFYIICFQHCFREALHHTVVSNGNGRVAKAGGKAHRRPRVTHCVH